MLKRWKKLNTNFTENTRYETYILIFMLLHELSILYYTISLRNKFIQTNKTLTIIKLYVFLMFLFYLSQRNIPADQEETSLFKTWEKKLGGRDKRQFMIDQIKEGSNWCQQTSEIMENKSFDVIKRKRPRGNAVIKQEFDYNWDDELDEDKNMMQHKKTKSMQSNVKRWRIPYGAIPYDKSIIL